MIYTYMIIKSFWYTLRLDLKCNKTLYYKLRSGWYVCKTLKYLCVTHKSGTCYHWTFVCGISPSEQSFNKLKHACKTLTISVASIYNEF